MRCPFYQEFQENERCERCKERDLCIIKNQEDMKNEEDELELE